MNCEQCGKTMGKGITLIGGRDAVLCTNCLVEWHHRVHGDKAWARSIRLAAKQNTLAGRAFAGNAPSEEEWQDYHIAYDDNHKALFALADRWLRESQNKNVSNDESKP